MLPELLSALSLPTAPAVPVLFVAVQLPARQGFLCPCVRERYSPPGDEPAIGAEQR